VALEVSFQNSSCAKFNKQLRWHVDGNKWGCIHKFDILDLELLRPVNNHRKLTFMVWHIHREGADCLLSHLKPKHTKKRRYYIFFILVRTTTKSIQFIYKPVFLFWFFPCCCFGFISKAATTKNCQFIYNLSMLSLGLEVTTLRRH
jgi:hypothetical protein